jgi:hypothetical protein
MAAPAWLRAVTLLLALAAQPAAARVNHCLRSNRTLPTLTSRAWLRMDTMAACRTNGSDWASVAGTAPAISLSITNPDGRDVQLCLASPATCAPGATGVQCYSDSSRNARGRSSLSLTDMPCPTGSFVDGCIAVVCMDYAANCSLTATFSADSVDVPPSKGLAVGSIVGIVFGSIIGCALGGCIRACRRAAAAKKAAAYTSAASAAPAALAFGAAAPQPYPPEAYAQAYAAQQPQPVVVYPPTLPPATSFYPTHPGYYAGGRAGAYPPQPGAV